MNNLNLVVTYKRFGQQTLHFPYGIWKLLETMIKFI